MSKHLSVYIHIPFCKSKCHYCDFLSWAGHSAEVQERYVKALLREIEMVLPAYRENYAAYTVFIGGGTPSVLPAAAIEALMEKLNNTCDIFNNTRNETDNTRNVIHRQNPEITIEANPGTLSTKALQSYRRAGINRLSIGLQSPFNQDLIFLGRPHTYEDFLATYHEARAAGFANINIDLIQSLPNHTQALWNEALAKVVELGPEHVSAYGLTIEPNTPLAALDGANTLSEEEDRAIYHQTRTFLANKNYTRYEISNYARYGFECQHNLTYWRRGDYLGLGLGASSLMGNVRWRNVKGLFNYMEILESTYPQNVDNSDGLSRLREELHTLSITEQMEEFIFLGLRLTEGVSRARFREAFARELDNVYEKPLADLTALGLLEETEHGESIRLTDAGVDVSNRVLAEFLL
jgi:oxygen-independent coproporphyrinogen-3 oxidase